MKRITLTISVLLTATLILIFVSCSKSKNSSSFKNGSESAKPGITNGKIAYVEIDSIISNYEMAKDLKSSLEVKQRQLEAELNTKSKLLQADEADFKSKYQKGIITQSNAQELQQELGSREQILYQLQDKDRAEINEDLQVNQHKLLQNIMNYLKIYNKDKGYQYILANSTILYADSTNNITKEVIKGLNDTYKKEFGKK